MPAAPNRGERKCETCIHFTDEREAMRKAYNTNDGFCEWKCPPILKRLLWGEWGERAVKATDWCHCWEPVSVGPTIAGLPMIETPATSAVLAKDNT